MSLVAIIIQSRVRCFAHQLQALESAESINGPIAGLVADLAHAVRHGYCRLGAVADRRIRTYFALILFAGGLLFVTCSSLTTSLAQLLAPSEFRGRVVSIFLVAFLGGSPLGGLASGWLVTRVGSAPLILVVNGAALTLVIFSDQGQGLKDI